MSHAINTVACKLLEFDIVTPEGYAALLQEVCQLKRNPHATSWRVTIDRDNAVIFNATSDERGTPIIPQISCKGISVAQIQNEHPPFTALDIALEIHDDTRKSLSRWHVDWANSTDGISQPGPLVHLQYGGHRPGQRQSDHPLKVPRWCHPPVDILILCELVAANFYEEKWERLREDLNWCNAIAVGQRLCYKAYLRKMTDGLSISSKTLLHSMWASEWRSAPSPQL
ncbi:hypothetical protein [Limnobacter sp. CACIAM 66H1]|uniref:hypothetical protein n=1 Tax=Limnobacter sp. CACIAM 66H1 TaxID=1813033 RepID=UPI0025BAB822|nr:hypothetical protein [Limnobacter sp. CACIAM 66H1]